MNIVIIVIIIFLAILYISAYLFLYALNKIAEKEDEIQKDLGSYGEMYDQE